MCIFKKILFSLNIFFSFSSLNFFLHLLQIFYSNFLGVPFKF